MGSQIRGVVWRGVAWSGVEWRGVAWNGAEWNGVAWRGVAWRGVAAAAVKTEEGRNCRPQIVSAVNDSVAPLTTGSQCILGN
jgi:hypothetical protein